MNAPNPLAISANTDLLSNVWRMSVERYHGMIQAGLLTEDDRIELLEGVLVEKMTINPPHALVTGTLFDLLSRVIPSGTFVGSQQPLTTEDSEPEPDVMVVYGVRSDFGLRHPSPREVALVIEVSDSTLLRDQTTKKRIYASAMIPAYWIVNLPERLIEVHTEPSGPSASPTYRQLQTYSDSDQIPVMLDDEVITTLAVADLLPPK